MKTKTKTFVVVEIAIVLCSMLLVALPAIAATSEIYEPGPLDVFGNANGDDIIDMRDTTYIKLAIFGKKPKTDLADANNDGKVSMLDVGQTKLIILGKEKKLTLIDDLGRIVTVNKPILRIVTINYRLPELLVVIGAKDKIVGVESRFKTRMKDIAEAWDMMEVSVIGTSKLPDYEQILELKPDVIITALGMIEPEEVTEKLPGIPVIAIFGYDSDYIIYDLRLLGMIVDEEDGAANIIDFMQNYEGIIEERTKELNPEEIPTFYLEGPTSYSIYGPSSLGKLAEGCGGRNIAPEIGTGSSSVEVSPEWVLEKNPDIVIKRAQFLGLDATEDDAEKTLNEFIGRTGWDELSAVKKNRAYLLEGDLIFTPRYLAGRCYLAKWFQPELFEDFDPEGILREYHEEFMGIEYRGIWAYPPPK
ncbi:MAG: ABC transporter substrate-binding protein [Methanophagales archaeon]|nr:ABC transporter substrate-binding protein [Methanophagales archaeon]